MITILILHTFLSIGRAAEVATPGGGGFSGADAASNLGTNMIGTSAIELSCLLSKADPNVSKADAMTTADGLQKALKLIRFPEGKFTRTSLLHFLAQSLAETGHLKYTEQLGNVSADKKGWGLIQVTGPANMKECCDCVNSCAPGEGDKIRSSPAATMGNGTSERTNAALLSLCWWRKNVTQNEAHAQISNTNDGTAARRMTEIVNAGGVGRKVTGGETNLAQRERYFQQLSSLDSGGSCRTI